MIAAPRDTTPDLDELRASLEPMPAVTAELRVRLPAGEVVHVSVAGPHRLVGLVLHSAADGVIEEVER